MKQDKETCSFFTDVETDNPTQWRQLDSLQVFRMKQCQKDNVLLEIMSIRISILSQ